MTAAFLVWSLVASARTLTLGPARAQRDSSAAALEFSFVARADEQISAARLRIAHDALPPVDVVVNDERVATLEGAGVREVAVPAGLVSDRNTLTLRLRNAPACGAPAAAWRALRKVEALLETQPVALPDELALLPLPFYDRGYDEETTVPVVLPPGVEPQAGATAAAWFAVDAPIPVRFTASRTLPESSALVLIASAEQAATLGLQAPDGPSVRMIDHPAHPGSNVKLVLIGGRTAAELRTALDALATGRQHLGGPGVALTAPPPSPPAAPDDAPRWVPTAREVPFGRYPGENVLAHDGVSPATLSVRFRVPPDVFVWPREFVALDLGWKERGAPRPRLTVEFNGEYVASLPATDAGRARLRIPREHLRGFNQLFVHVQHDACAAPGGEPPHVEITPDSSLHVEGAPHFAQLPDVSLFAFDGWPFTRLADLAATAVVLPDQPAEAELSMALSVIGRFAQVTGRVPTRERFLAASQTSDAALGDADVLLIGSPADNAVLARWSAQLPLAPQSESARVHRPETPKALLELLGGAGPLIDERRANQLLAGRTEFAAIESIESPAHAGRAAVAVTAPDGAKLPPFAAFLGYAESRTSAGDLLLLTGGQLAMFRVGGSFARGELGAWTALRFFLANHWLLLLPVVLAGALLFARDAGRGLKRRMHARLHAPSALRETGRRGAAA